MSMSQREKERLEWVDKFTKENNERIEKQKKHFYDTLDDLINNGEDEFVKEMGSFIKEQFDTNLGGWGTQHFFGWETFLNIIELHRETVKEDK
tara:strand:+ start:126 stop:404 length:279 start_codon:yes stop_codon:yes gene_type:complete